MSPEFAKVIKDIVVALANAIGELIVLYSENKS